VTALRERRKRALPLPLPLLLPLLLWRQRARVWESARAPQPMQAPLRKGVLAGAGVRVPAARGPIQGAGPQPPDWAEQKQTPPSYRTKPGRWLL